MTVCIRGEVLVPGILLARTDSGGEIFRIAWRIDKMLLITCFTDDETVIYKTDAAIQLIRNALTAGIKTDYVLMDTWFTTEPMLKEILDTGIDAIGMVKQLKQRYTYNGRQYTLPGLKKFVDFSSAGNIFGSLVVTTKTGIPVKIVFVRNRNKKSECLYLLSTDTSLNNAEIVRIYGNHWSIECFFKASKSFLKLGSEFQSRSYGAMVSHTTIVFTRYIILEWIRRNQNDQKRLHEEKSVMS